jgi:hypothetical protein
MKARQLAIAVNSVYAIDPHQRLQTIERDSDGLWGPWQDAGADARYVVHEGDIVARIGLDGRLSALQRSPDSRWQDLELEARSLAATRLPGGAPMLFASDGDNLVWHTWKPTPDSPWTPWQSLAGFAVDVRATVIPHGGPVLFGLQDGSIYHRWQDQPHGAWRDWTPIDDLPGGSRAIEVASLTGGGLVLFALGRDGGLYHRWQDKPFGRWHLWEVLGTGIEQFSLTKPASGGLAVFIVARDGCLRHRRQAKPFGAWGSWVELDRAARGVAAQPSYTDGLEVFRIGMDQEISHCWCDSLEGPWTEWVPLEREGSPFRPATRDSQ